MHHNYVLPTVTEALPVLLTEIENQGDEIGSRAGLTKELTHVGITLTEPMDREILCDYRKPNLAAQIAETMWVLSGRDDIAWLENYLPRVRDFSDDGQTWRAGYGARLRRWEDHGQPKVVDQWRWLVQHMKEDRATRRGVMSIWDPVIDTDPGKDIPCNDWLSFLSRLGRLDLHVAIRSNDIIWGWSGINQFEWSALLEMTAGMLGVEPGNLHFSTTSFHLYGHHFAKAERIRNQTLTNLDHLAPAPRFDASVFDRDFDRLEELFRLWFSLENHIRLGSDVVDEYVDNFPEPMMRSWLRILQWWWSEGDTGYLRPLAGTRLFEATRYSVQPKKETPGERALRHSQNAVLHYAGGPDAISKHIPEEEMVEVRNGWGEVVAEWPMSEFNPSPFIQFATRTHDEKHAAYGDSWKKRGEMLGILANIARKVDRLGKGETSDETSADTAMDLMVYLAKYRAWLLEDTDDTKAANHILLRVDDSGNDWSHTQAQASEDLEEFLRERFEELEATVMKDEPRFALVDDMLVAAYVLAARLWTAEQDVDEYRGADVD